MFAEEVRLAGRMSWGIGVGLKAIAEKFHMTVQNAFVSLNQQSFSMADGAFEVDWSGLMVSGGPVAPVELTETVVDSSNVLNVKFEPNRATANSNRFDNIYLYVYCPDIATGYLAAPVYRMDKRIRLALLDSFAGRELHLYCFAVDKDGNASVSSYGHILPASAQDEYNPNTTSTEQNQTSTQPLNGEMYNDATISNTIDSASKSEGLVLDGETPPPLII